MFRRLLKLPRDLRRRFYDGPAVFSYPGRKMQGYRSPNLLIALWIRAFMVTVFTGSGRLLVLIGGLIFLVGIASLLMPVFLLSFTLLSLFIVDIVLGFLARPKLHIQRAVPASAAVGAPVRLDYLIVNKRRIPAWDVYVDTIPTEKEIAKPNGEVYLGTLDPGELRRASHTIVVSRRGEYELPLPLADSAFPFGLWKWHSRGEPTKPLVVYPDYTPLVSLRLPVGQRYQPGTMTIASTSGGANEFYGCREYRYGDNPRHLHAPSWARLAKPIVKEFRDEYFCRTAVLLDTYIQPLHPLLKALGRENEPFEAALSVTAAVVDFLLSREYMVDFYVPGRPPLKGGGGRGESHLQTVLDILACQEEHAEGSFPGLPNELIMEIRQISATVIVFLGWDRYREAMVDELRQAGIAVRALLIVGDRPPAGAIPAEVTQLRAADLRSGQVVEL